MLSHAQVLNGLAKSVLEHINQNELPENCTVHIGPDGGWITLEHTPADAFGVVLPIATINHVRVFPK